MVRSLSRPIAAAAVVSLWGFVSCGASSTQPRHAPKAHDAPAISPKEPSGPTAEWQQWVADGRVWTVPELANYCPHERAPSFVSEANDADVRAAHENGCKLLKSSAEGAYFCCEGSLPVAPNPTTGGGKSCDQALFEYKEASAAGDESKRPSAGQYGAVLNRGSYFAHCHVPQATKLDVCAAVRDGSAVGVTVHTEPFAPELASCVAKSVRSLKFPSHPRMDVTMTHF